MKRETMIKLTAISGVMLILFVFIRVGQTFTGGIPETPPPKSADMNFTYNDSGGETPAFVTLSSGGNITVSESPKFTNVTIPREFAGTIQIGTNFFTREALEEKPVALFGAKSKIGDSHMSAAWFNKDGTEREKIDFIYETDGKGLTNLVAKTDLEPITTRTANGWEIRFKEVAK